MEESATSQHARSRLRTGSMGLVRPDSGLELDEETMNQLTSNQSVKMRDTEAEWARWRIAFVQSGWHRDIVAQGRTGFLAEMERRSVPSGCIDIYDVPGAFEIPLRAKMLARSGQYAAIVACGFIVDGGIYRHEFVATAVINALMTVQIETEVPVISVVLTPQHFHDHDEHRAFFTQHFVVKGTEAASACFDTLMGHEAASKLRQSP
jgi:6,7-dimethyl-8-ribityllumazine synthase